MESSSQSHEIWSMDGNIQMAVCSVPRVQMSQKNRENNKTQKMSQLLEE